jgi:hypothetical protein
MTNHLSNQLISQYFILSLFAFRSKHLQNFSTGISSLGNKLIGQHLRGNY